MFAERNLTKYLTEVELIFLIKSEKIVLNFNLRISLTKEKNSFHSTPSKKID